MLSNIVPEEARWPLTNCLTYQVPQGIVRKRSYWGSFDARDLRQCERSGIDHYRNHKRTDLLPARIFSCKRQILIVLAGGHSVKGHLINEKDCNGGIRGRTLDHHSSMGPSAVVIISLLRE